MQNYKALYKGWRFWVFENDFDRPYDIHVDPEWHQILLFDCEVSGITAAGYWTALGNIHGCVMWGQGVDFIAKDPADMVSSIKNYGYSEKPKTAHLVRNGKSDFT